MIITVSERIVYYYEVDEMPADLDAWFCEKENPWNEADNADVVDRSFEFDEEGEKWQTISREFSETDPQFQAELTEIADDAEKGVLEVFVLWKEYAATCTDQSALLFEFKKRPELRKENNP